MYMFKLPVYSVYSPLACLWFQNLIHPICPSLHLPLRLCLSVSLLDLSPSIECVPLFSVHLHTLAFKCVGQQARVVWSHPLTEIGLSQPLNSIGLA